MTNAGAFNRELGLKINREIWTGRYLRPVPLLHFHTTDGRRWADAKAG